MFSFCLFQLPDWIFKIMKPNLLELNDVLLLCVNYISWNDILRSCIDFSFLILYLFNKRQCQLKTSQVLIM